MWQHCPDGLLEDGTKRFECDETNQLTLRTREQSDMAARSWRRAENTLVGGLPKEREDMKDTFSSIRSFMYF